MDVLTREQRRLNMSRIRSRDTTPEIFIRKGLHAAGFRFRLHQRQLPGRPDLVLARYRTVIFVNGCFWHSHRCHISRVPDTRQDYWKPKLARNAKRDREALEALHAAGWRVVRVWECALRGRTRLTEGAALEKIADFIRNDTGMLLDVAGFAR
jgi:DNA mismatch endonuclease (patch repair protein)